MSRLRSAASERSEYLAIGAPLICTVPRVGASSRPIRLSSVLLPHPDGPMIETNSPSPTVRFTADSATVSMRSVR